MKIIRNNVFETNSSSTHSICISKTDKILDGSFISFNIGEFGWESNCVDPADYLYTAIMEREDRIDNLEKLKAILDKHHIKYSFSYYNLSHYELNDEQHYYLKDGYVDHSEELTVFLNDILNNENKLLRYLSGNTEIYTGNDNSCEYDNMCYAAKEYVYDDEYNKVPNPNHNEDKYEYYFKGN